MDDRFLNEMRRDPRPEFARDLRDRLRRQHEPRARWFVRPAPVFAAALAVAAVASLFAFPAVRASAQAMLDLFRVRRFAAVPFDEARIGKLRALAEARDPALLVFDDRQVVRDPGPALAYSDPFAAGAAAGLDVRRPTYLPEGLAADSVWVQGAGEARLTVREQKLRQLLESLDLRNVTVPAGLEGITVEVRTSPAVVQSFRGDRARATLIQTRSPGLSAPAGLDVERLAEIGLRVIGLEAAEARRVAAATDWRTTLVVPVPLDASTFRQVTVRGQQGLLVTTGSRDASGPGRQRDGSIVMWTEGDRVFAITGTLHGGDLLQMAESVQ
jgi:hypothetical protein